ncbi:hypothetical protein ACV8SV_27280, partial [Citrobacter freundii]
IRTLLVQCARVFIQKLEHQSGKLADWVRELLCRKSNFVVTCARGLTLSGTKTHVKGFWS